VEYYREGGGNEVLGDKSCSSFPVSLQNVIGRLRIEPVPLRRKADGLPHTSEQHHYI
jgi:hypothetical protein